MPRSFSMTGPYDNGPTSDQREPSQCSIRPEKFGPPNVGATIPDNQTSLGPASLTDVANAKPGVGLSTDDQLEPSKCSMRERRYRPPPTAHTSSGDEDETPSNLQQLRGDAHRTYVDPFRRAIYG